jgi:hypothetical protein
MERSKHTHGIQSGEPPASAPMGDTGQSTNTAPSATARRAGGRLAMGWHFVRHLLEMVLAMMVGMGFFGLALWVFGEPPGYSNLLVEYGLMGAFMAATMVGWMRFRGHSWRDGGEMSAAMLVPMLAPVALVDLGVAVPGFTEGSLMLISHVAMIGGMVALMLYRFERYAHASYGRHG